MAKATVPTNRRLKGGRLSSLNSASKRAAVGSTGGRSAARFLERRSIEELAAEQGVRLEGQLARVLGAGAHLWETDEDFAEFVRGIYDRRREGLSLSKQ
jgi:hypothetical protein